MPRYTLRTYYNAALLEKYEHRSYDKLRGLLKYNVEHPQASEDQFGEPLKHLNRVEILDSRQEKIFNGSVADALVFSRTLK